jgi:hypothetical protein
MTNTVYVIGASTSAEAELPTGLELKDETKVVGLVG